MLGLMLVTLDAYILPSLISNTLPVDLSVISCPKAPNNLVFGSIKVSVPIPETLSLT